MYKVPSTLKLVLVQKAAALDVLLGLVQLVIMFVHPILVIALDCLREFLEKAKHRARRLSNDAIWLVLLDFLQCLSSMYILAEIPAVGQIHG